MEDMKVNTIYDLMIGAYNMEEFHEKGFEHVVNEFDQNMECGKLYKEVYEANRRICERLGVEEDSDVERIIDCMFDISEILAKRMYLYVLMDDHN